MGMRGPGGEVAGVSRGGAPQASGMRNGKYRLHELAPTSSAMWDLTLAPRAPRYWQDPLDPEREAAWRRYETEIFSRWASAYAQGERPAGWWTFDAHDAICDAVAAGKITAARVDELLAGGWRGHCELVLLVDPRPELKAR